jgi:16S rRNA (guanine1207-N2)-methyltransferase
MIIPKNPSVLLDLGCGYGPVGIVLGFESPQSIIYFIDINKRAIWCVKENIKLNLPYNRKQYISFLGNYFDPIKTKNLKFDGIYMNPPLRQGRKEFLNIFGQLPHHLKREGFFQFVIKKKMGAEYIFKYLEDNYSESNIEILCKRSGYWVFNMDFY